MVNRLSLEDFDLGKSFQLEPSPGWPKHAQHVFERKEAIAVLAALGINRPLLVRGEPGCGKTQLARAVAQKLKMPLARLMVNERTESEDLYYRYDALLRLSDANASGTCIREQKAYLTPGPLWWALSHETAKAFNGSEKQGDCINGKPHFWQGLTEEEGFQKGVVLLIDEIDKADRSVPNGLLEALGNFSFTIPYTGETIQWDREKSPAPLVIITSNREQELPPAFVRRCLVLNLELPEEKEKFIHLLAQRGEALFHEKPPFAHRENRRRLFEQIAETVWEKRQDAKKSSFNFLPGQAEYLDHLEALTVVEGECRVDGKDDDLTQLAALFYSKG